MKKISILLTFTLLLSMFISGCSNDADSENEIDAGTEKISVVTTNFPAYDFVRSIAGDKVDLTMLIPPGSEIHSYEPTPKDIQRIEASDLFVYTGGESDQWIEDLTESLDTSNINSVTMMSLVDVVDEEIVEGMEDEHEEEAAHEEENEHEGELDEHVWTSPVNAQKIVNGLSEKLVKIDPANADFYTANTAEYSAKLAELDNKFKDVVSTASRDIIIFADRFPFRYLVDEYGLKYHAAFSGCSTETEASAATVSFLIDKVKSEDIPIVFTIELSNAKIADTIVEATGAKKSEMHSAHMVSKEEFDSGVTYLELMTENTEKLKEALS